MRRLLAGFAALAASGLTFLSPADAQTTWKVYTYAPAATQPNAQALNRIAEALGTETGGQLKLQVHIGGSLPINSTNITQAVSDNVIQVGDDAFFQGNIPYLGLIRLPMLIGPHAEYLKALEVMKPYFEKAYTKKGAIILGYYNYPLQMPFSKKPIASIADLKGQKLRVSSPEQGEFLRRMGGVPVTIGPAEVPSALDRGVVEGVFTASAGGGRLWKDLLAHNLRIGVNWFDAVIVVNKEAFDKVSPDTQAKVRKHFAENAPRITEELAKDEADVKDKLGFTVTEPKPDELAQAVKTMAPYWDEWAKTRGPDAVEALAKVRAALGR